MSHQSILSSLATNLHYAKLWISVQSIQAILLLHELDRYHPHDVINSVRKASAYVAKLKTIGYQTVLWHHTLQGLGLYIQVLQLVSQARGSLLRLRMTTTTVIP